MGGGISMCFVAAAEKQRHHHHEKEEEELRGKILALEEQIEELKSACRDDREKWKEEEEEEEDDDDDETVRRASSPKMKYLTEEEEKLRWLASAAAATASSSRRRRSSEKMQRRNEWYFWRSDELVEQMMEERDEAAEKWKQLYLAIKAELDLLIHKTQRVDKIEAALGLMRKGERFDWKAEELMMEWHAKELRAQEEMIETLRSRIAVMEKEEAKRDREMDILRQSLKILGTNATKSDLIIRKKKTLFPAAGCLL